MDDAAADRAVLAFGPFRLDPVARTLVRDGETIPLTPTVFDLLLCLARRAGSVVTKDELFDCVWQGRIVEEANIRQTVFVLRRALGPAGEALIATAPGRGYRFTGQVAPAPAVGAEPPPPSTPLRRAPTIRWRGFSALVVGAAALVVLCAWLWLRPAPLGHGGSVVLARIANRTGEPIFERTLAQRLRVDLAQSPFIDPLPDREAREALADPNAADKPLTSAQGEMVCRRRGARAVIGGEIAHSGAGYVLGLHATGCDGSSLAARRETVPGRDGVVAALDRLTLAMRGDLGEAPASRARFNVPSAGTPSLAALAAYSDADWLMSHGRPSEAAPLDRTAIELDPSFAQAWAHLGVVYETQLDKARGAAALEQAYRLRGALPERERLRIIALHNQFVSGDLDETLANLRVWTQTYPRDAAAWTNLANAEVYYGMRAQGVIDARRALDLRPSLEAPYAVLSRALLGLGDLAGARQAAALAQTRGLAGAAVHRESLRIAIAAGDRAGIARENAWASAHPPSLLLQAVDAEYALSEGRLKAAQAIYRSIAASFAGSGQPNVVAGGWARLLAEVGETGAARQLLEEPGDRTDGDRLVAQALTGRGAVALDELQRQQADQPASTLTGRIVGPQVRAATALQRGRADEAIAALAMAAAFAQRNFDIPYLQGVALLDAGQPGQAAQVFRLILAHRGWYPESALYPLARLELARALAAGGDRAGAADAYRQSLDAWRAADPDFPPLIAARREMQALSVASASRVRRAQGEAPV